MAEVPKHPRTATPGERSVARAIWPGSEILDRRHDVLSEFSGALTGVYADVGLDVLRDEYD
jgi:hypothetical protein